MTTVLPRLLILTDRHACTTHGRTLTQTVERAVEAGARTIVLREKDLPAPERLDLATRLRAILDNAGGMLIVASDAPLARSVRAAGVHLAASDPLPPRGGLVVGRSCHNAAELRTAADDGLDYVTLSPVFPSSSKPSYGPPLELDRLAALVVTVAIPVYALGGIGPRRARACLRSGAHGVAAMGAVMAADDPGQVVADLLDELQQPANRSHASRFTP